MTPSVYKFEVSVQGNLASHESFPIYDDAGKLLGAFARSVDDLIACWVAGDASPVALKVSTGDRFYITPKFDAGGCMMSCILTEVRLSVESVEVQKAGERVTYGQKAL